MNIRIGSFLDRAVKTIVRNVVQRNDGLWVPPDYIAGKHFGGFQGYAPWIQDCIRACCESARGVGPDELSELSAVAMWQPPSNGGVNFTIQKHADTMVILERLADRVAAQGTGLTDKIREQIRRVDGSRERGTLMVIALNPTETERTGELPASVSAWNPASIEEAQAVPKQKFAGSAWLSEMEALRRG